MSRLNRNSPEFYTLRLLEKTAEESVEFKRLAKAASSSGDLLLFLVEREAYQIGNELKLRRHNRRTILPKMVDYFEKTLAGVPPMSSAEGGVRDFNCHDGVLSFGDSIRFAYSVLSCKKEVRSISMSEILHLAVKDQRQMRHVVNKRPRDLRIFDVHANGLC